MRHDTIDRNRCCILNTGISSWLFEEYATRLSRVLGIDVTTEPRDFCYTLGIDEDKAETVYLSHYNFINLRSIELASDKRKLARVFIRHSVATPTTHLISNFEGLKVFLEKHAHNEWCLKFPTSCGASGHTLLTDVSQVPRDWPTPYLVQEFIRLDYPCVYRAYGLREKIFGWNVRHFPKHRTQLPWVSHARGAVYEHYNVVPYEVEPLVRKALYAVGLEWSYGCVDLIQRFNGQWLVLEVGTDGIYTHVDCFLENENVEHRLLVEIKSAFEEWYHHVRKLRCY